MLMPHMVYTSTSVKSFLEVTILKPEAYVYGPFDRVQRFCYHLSLCQFSMPQKLVIAVNCPSGIYWCINYLIA